jgi:hypothetical protein
MRRTLRRLATVAALVSLLLCVASVVMWARSYWKSDWWSRFSYNVQTHEYRQQFLGSEAGKAATILWSYKIDDSSAEKMEARTARGEFSNRWSKGAFGVLWPTRQHWWESGLFAKRYTEVRRSVPGVGQGVMVIVPHWILVVVFSIWPVVWGLRWWRRERKLRAGLCWNCGYDLRATPGRCPECGEERTQMSELRIQNCVD